jgi:hypothetical protein
MSKSNTALRFRNEVGESVKRSLESSDETLENLGAASGFAPGTASRGKLSSEVYARALGAMCVHSVPRTRKL